LAALALVGCNAFGQTEPQQFGKKLEADYSLTGDGIIFVEADRSVHYLRFGSDRAEVERLAASHWSEPLRQRSDGCETGPMEFADYRTDLHMLTYRNGKLVGWVAQPETEGSDVITRRMVEAEDDFAMAGAVPLGPKFTFDRDGGTISGVFTDKGPDANVQVLWAGDLCQF